MIYFWILLGFSPLIVAILDYIRLTMFSKAFDKVFDAEDWEKDDEVVDVFKSYDNFKSFHVWDWNFDKMIVMQENKFKNIP